MPIFADSRQKSVTLRKLEKKISLIMLTYTENSEEINPVHSDIIGIQRGPFKIIKKVTSAEHIALWHGRSSRTG